MIDSIHMAEQRILYITRKISLGRNIVQYLWSSYDFVLLLELSYYIIPASLAENMAL